VNCTTSVVYAELESAAQVFDLAGADWTNIDNAFTKDGETGLNLLLGSVSLAFNVVGQLNSVPAACSSALTTLGPLIKSMAQALPKAASTLRANETNYSTADATSASSLPLMS
jgi:hypothetical protein